MNKSDLSKLINSGKTALIVIDMQGDYCAPGFYMDKAGYDIQRLRKPIEPIQKLLQVARSVDMPIIFTRQYRVSDQEDETSSFPLTSLKGDPGWEIIPELKPKSGEVVLDKTTCSVFASTNINEILQNLDVENIIFCGNTLDVCVHSSLRSAIDLGYDCVTVSDACGAVNEHLFKWSLESICVEDGVFGSVVESKDLFSATHQNPTNKS